MSCDTLVLDRNWRPVDVTSWQNAIKLWFEGVAKVIREDDSKILHSQYFNCGMPRVIVVNNTWKILRKANVTCTRRNIYIRDRGQCQYCDKHLSLSSFTLDHVYPRCLGGLDTWENLVVACAKCNRKKSGLTLAEAGMKLLRLPVRPSNLDKKFRFKLQINKMRPEWADWKDWLQLGSWSYWNVEFSDSEQENA